jgi:Flp pilus assembly protein TadG
MVELALLLPWYFFVFVGAFDWGHYAYALISVQNAARVAALRTSSSPGAAADSDTACAYALGELAFVSNVGGALASCNADPLVVTAAAVDGPDHAPASQVSVRYRTPQLIPIPGLLPGRITISRTVRMRVRG